MGRPCWLLTLQRVWAKGGLKERCQPHTVVAVRAEQSYGTASELGGPAVSIAHNKQINNSFNRLKARFNVFFFFLSFFLGKLTYIKARINTLFIYFAVLPPPDL